jgi:hypothetical protein
MDVARAEREASVAEGAARADTGGASSDAQTVRPGSRWALRGTILVIGIALAVCVGIWKRGAATGSFEANLLSRAAVIARTAPEVDASYFPGLSGTGAAAEPEYAQVWDERGVTIYRSKSLGTQDLPTTAPANRRLLNMNVETGSSYGVRLEVPMAGGANRTVFYMTSYSPLGWDVAQSVWLTFVLIVLPAALVAYFLPARRKSRMTAP